MNTKTYLQLEPRDTHNKYIVSRDSLSLTSVQSKLLEQEKQKNQITLVFAFIFELLGAASLFVILFVALWAGAVLQ